MGLESQELLILRVENSESGGGVIMTNDKSYVGVHVYYDTFIFCTSRI